MFGVAADMAMPSLKSADMAVAPFMSLEIYRR
jgi:hypothetical protein